MIGLKEKVGVLPEVELDNYPSVLSGVARIDVDPSSGTVRVVPTVVVDSCLSVPDDALPAYRPTEIVYGGKRYVFREPLDCEVSWDAEYSFYWIRYAPFELVATGYSMSEAIEEFSFKLSDTYEWFNELHAHREEAGALRLGVELEGVRCLLNESLLGVYPVINH
jgi:hypothetical protein